MVQLSSENMEYLQQILRNHKYHVQATPEMTKFDAESLVILVKNNNNIVVIDKRGQVDTVYKDLKIAAQKLASSA